jgi:2-oxoisovalerate dehydrogenase E1 component
MPHVKDLKPMAVWQQIEATDADWNRLGREELFRMLVDLHLTRAFEEALLTVAGDNLINGPVHSSIGEEASAIGVTSALRDTDQVGSSHRGHSQFLGKVLRFVDKPNWNPLKNVVPGPIHNVLRRTFAEVMGLAQGYCKGRGGSMHLRNAEAGCIGSNAIIGGGVPFAAGEAWAKKRKGEGDVVFCFFGDGSIHIGAVPETLNLAALYDLPICFFIVNNGFAVSTTLEEQSREIRMSSRGLGFGIPSFRVDGMDPVAVRSVTEQAVELMRAGKGPVIIEALVYRYLHHSGSLAGSAFGYRTKDEEAKWRSRDPLSFLARGMIERGWLTQEEDELLRKRAQDALSDVVDSLTELNGNHRQIRQGLLPDPSSCNYGVRGDLSEFDGVSFVERETFSGALAEGKFIEALPRVMGRRMETDDRVFVIGEDIHRLRGGTNGQTRGLPERFPDRIVPTPISEGSFCGLAGGVALEGTYRPVVELMYPDFALVAADQLFNQIAKVRHMFGGDSRVPLVLRSKAGIGAGYGAQHSMDPAGLYANWPGWRIVAPSTPFDYIGLFNSALRCEDPVLVIEHVQLYPTSGLTPVEDLDYYIPLGKAKIVRSGTSFTVLTYSYMTTIALQVAKDMGIDPEIIDLRSLDRAGLDWETNGASVRKTNNVVIVEEGSLTASYGGMLADEVQRRLFDHLDQPIKRVYGGEASPSVSRVLELAAIVGATQVREAFANVLSDKGDRSWAA